MTKTERNRLRNLLNTLTLKPFRVCKTEHECCLCPNKIRYGEQYRDGGRGKRAHIYCIDTEAGRLKDA